MRLTGDYVLWSHRTAKSTYWLGELHVAKKYVLRHDAPLAASFPKRARFSVDTQPRHGYRPGKDKRLLDNVLNSDHLIVVSKRLREALETERVGDIEYLPIDIRDENDRSISRDHFIVHPLRAIDCLDLARSKPTYSKLVPGKIDRVRKVVLDPDKIDPARRLFRVKGFPSVTLVRRDLAAAIDAAALSGVLWLELSEYGK